jgi:glycine/D-amino acid oxidase-like deaminating enzyme
MQRRRFLTRLAGLAPGAALPGRLLAATRSPRIVVVGGGIVGVAIAFRLTPRGARVTLLDEAGPAARATGHSFAWLNTEFAKEPFHYHQLHRLRLAADRLPEQELPGLPVQWGGALKWNWDVAAAQHVRRRVRQQQDWGYPVRLIDAVEFRGMEGEVRAGNSAAARYAEQEGLAGRWPPPGCSSRRPPRPARRSSRRARSRDSMCAGRVAAARTARGDLPAELLVVATGVPTPAVAAMTGIQIPLVPASGLRVHTKPVPPLVRRIAIGPAAHVKH